MHWLLSFMLKIAMLKKFLNIKKIVDLLKKEKPDIVILFKNWFLNVFQNEDDEFYEAIYNLQEIKNMLSTSLKKYREKLFEQGWIEGREEGMVDKTIETVRNMLKLKFLVKDICAVTKLFVEDVEKIKNGEF